MSETEKPFVTFALFAYNQEQYIREAVEGAFSQSYEPLEIILSDDCSTDRTFEIMQNMVKEYQGRHKVIAQCNENNLGIGQHVSKIINQAHGEYVAFAAGDDISNPDRVEHAMSTLMAIAGNNKQFSFLSTVTLIDKMGQVIGNTSVPTITTNSRLTNDVAQFGLKDLLNGVFHTSGPTRIIPKNLHLIFGDIREACFTEDIVYFFRSVLAGKVAFSNKQTVQYRKHDTNISMPETLYARSFEGVSEQLFADLQVAIEKGFLTKNEENSALKWIESNAALRNFYKTKLNGKRPSIYDLLLIFRSSHLKLRRKFGIFREYIGIR